MRPGARRAWPWVRAALIGFVTLTTMAEFGYGKFSAGLIPPGLLIGSLAGCTARAVRVGRSWLGSSTMWVAAASLWGVIVFAVLKSAPRCPLEETTMRCGTDVASTWGINAALAVVVLMLLIEPPKIYYRMLRSGVRRIKERRAGQLRVQQAESTITRQTAAKAAAGNKARNEHRQKKRKAARRARKR